VGVSDVLLDENVGFFVTEKRGGGDDNGVVA
jgi:hypothetical protein